MDQTKAPQTLPQSESSLGKSQSLVSSLAPLGRARYARWNRMFRNRGRLRKEGLHIKEISQKRSLSSGIAERMNLSMRGEGNDNPHKMRDLSTGPTNDLQHDVVSHCGRWHHLLKNFWDCVGCCIAALSIQSRQKIKNAILSARFQIKLKKQEVRAL